MCSVISKSSSFGPDRSEIKRCKWKDRIIDESESELFDQLLFFHFFLVFLKEKKSNATLPYNGVHTYYVE